MMSYQLERDPERTAPPARCDSLLLRLSGLGARYALSTGHDRSGTFVDEFMVRMNPGRGAISHHFASLR
jgi:hypothetical protein